MRRTISARQTGLLKVLSILWIGAFTAVTLSLFCMDKNIKNQAGEPIPPALKWLFLAATIAGTLLLYGYGVRLKQVAIEGASLVISTYKRTAVIAFADIETVHQNRWLSTRPVTISFRQETVFGRSIIFMPELRWNGVFAPVHPIVAELRTAGKVQGESK
jgi:hypothetical protein